MALGSSGISISAVSTYIGVGTNDLGGLCWHEKVNRWSKFKPSIFRGNVADRTTVDTIVNAARKHYIINKLSALNSNQIYEDRLVLHYPRYADNSKALSTANPYTWRPYLTYPNLNDNVVLNLGTMLKEFALGDFRLYDHYTAKPTLSRLLKYQFGVANQQINVQMIGTNLADYADKFDGYVPVIALNPHTNIYTSGNDIHSSYTPLDAWGNPVNIPGSIGVLYYGDKLEDVAISKGISLPNEAYTFNKVMLHCGFNDEFGQQSMENNYVLFLDDDDANAPVMKDANYKIELIRNPEMISRKQYITNRPATNIQSVYVEDNSQFFNIDNITEAAFQSINFYSDQVNDVLRGTLTFQINIVDRNNSSNLYIDEDLTPSLTIFSGLKDDFGEVSVWENQLNFSSSQITMSVDNVQTTYLIAGNGAVNKIEISQPYTGNQMWESWLATKLGKTVATLTENDFSRLVIRIDLSLARIAGALTLTLAAGHNSPFSENHV